MNSTSPGAFQSAAESPHLRIAVIAHALRQGGGLSAGRSLVASLASSSRHTYLFTLPDLDEYRSIPIDRARHDVVYYRRRGGMVGRWAYDTFRLEKVIRRFQPDRILALGNRGIHNPPCAQAVFSRDAHLFYPSSHFGNENLSDKLKVAYQRWRFVKDLRHIHLLFCQTEVARTRLREVRGYNGRIAIAGNAISTAALEADGPARVRSGDPAGASSGSPDGDPVGAPPRFRPYPALCLLCLGSYYPHKNLEAVVEMFERHPVELDGVIVVITIEPGQHVSARRLLARIRKGKLEHRIVNVGPLSQEQIAAAYASCQALFLPTLLESFSRTYLEAMQFSRPILTSDLDFAHGICGDAAIYFDPTDTESMVTAINRLRDDPSLATILVEKGTKRLADIRQNWDEIASGMLGEVEALVSVDSGS